VSLSHGLPPAVSSFRCEASRRNASNAPVYVVDDVPVQPGPGGALIVINPHDIESIKVLKDPADTGIYGMRGANGVILITTKRPGKHPSAPASPNDWAP